MIQSELVSTENAQKQQIPQLVDDRVEERMVGNETFGWR